MDLGPGQERKYTIDFLSFMYAISLGITGGSQTISAEPKWNGMVRTFHSKGPHDFTSKYHHMIKT